jgi:hypothetical protein
MSLYKASAWLVDPFHHLARPEVAGGGTASRWRIAANILNMPSLTADKGWWFKLGVGQGADNSVIKAYNLTKHFTNPWTDSLVRCKKKKEWGTLLGIIGKALNILGANTLP